MSKTHTISRSVLILLIAQLLLTQSFLTNASGQVSASPTAPAPALHTPVLAETPPMGWNSWDGYGTTINEADFKANAHWFAEHLKPYGWQYVVIDAEWYVSDPVPEGNSKTSHYLLDNYGRYIPAANRFPSAVNGAGFKPLADYVHSLGLKFGIHILRGIPKQVVKKNLPIADSINHAADAADTSDTCPWNFDNYGLDSAKPGAQAYYDSIAKLYASWGVDLIKVDCISSHPYKGDEIRMLSSALASAGRPIVLSLSPGPVPVEKSDEMRKYAQMWRISNDIWDLWHNAEDYPKGVGDQFARAAEWAALSSPGHWADADMLPLGRLGPAPGWGQPRDTRLTHDEQQSLMTLWCIFRSPLMVGGNLTASNPWTLSLLTNPEVIEVDQHSGENHQVLATNKISVWLAQPISGNGYYVAVFNREDGAATIRYGWSDLGLPDKQYRSRDLWEHRDLGLTDSVEIILPAHGSLLYSIVPQAEAK